MKLGPWLVAVVLLSGCGGGGEVDDSADKKEQKQERRDLAAEVAAQECSDRLTPFLDALQEIDSRLNVGLQYAEYGEKLGDARVKYDRIDSEGLSPTCLRSVGTKLENAYNRYLEALHIWERCIDDYGCDFKSDAQPKLRDKWTAAGDELSEAQTALTRMAA